MGRAARRRGLRRGRRRRNVGVRAGGDRGAGDLPRSRPRVARLSRVAPLPRRPAALSARRGAHRDRSGARPAARVGPAPPAALVGLIAGGAFVATILIPRDLTTLARFKWTWAFLGLVLLVAPLLPGI